MPSPARSCCSWASEFAQWSEWNHDASLEWHLLDSPNHAGIRLLVGDLNQLYRAHPALHEREILPGCFEWVDAGNAEQNVIIFLRKAVDSQRTILVACNFSGVPRTNYQIGVALKGAWRETFNSDARPYGGSGFGNFGTVHTSPVPAHGHLHSIIVDLPASGVIYLEPELA